MSINIQPLHDLVVSSAHSFSAIGVQFLHQNRLDEIISDEKEFRTPFAVAVHVAEALNIYTRYLSGEVNAVYFLEKTTVHSFEEYNCTVKLILQNFEKILNSLKKMPQSEISRLLLQPKWGGEYDIEMFYEHIIVHNLRHQKQLEKLL